MKSQRHVLFAFAALGAVPVAFAARPVADIPPPDARKTAVETAQRLVRPPEEPKPIADLTSPFNPPGFAKAGPTTAAPTKAGDKPGAPAAPTAPATDQEILATLASKIPTTGTIIVGDKPLLVSGTNRIEVGSHFTVVFNGQEYELELVAIDRTTFTVRYKGEEFTRPIKLGRTP
jgi:hypothetical protein